MATPRCNGILKKNYPFRIIDGGSIYKSALREGGMIKRWLDGCMLNHFTMQLVTQIPHNNGHIILMIARTQINLLAQSC